MSFHCQSIKWGWSCPPHWVLRSNAKCLAQYLCCRKYLLPWSLHLPIRCLLRWWWVTSSSRLADMQHQVFGPVTQLWFCWAFLGLAPGSGLLCITPCWDQHLPRASSSWGSDGAQETKPHYVSIFKISAHFNLLLSLWLRPVMWSSPTSTEWRNLKNLLGGAGKSHGKGRAFL